MTPPPGGGKIALNGGRRLGKDQPSSEGSTRMMRGWHEGQNGPPANELTPKEKPTAAVAGTTELPCGRRPLGRPPHLGGRTSPHRRSPRPEQPPRRAAAPTCATHRDLAVRSGRARNHLPNLHLQATAAKAAAAVPSKQAATTSPPGA